MKVTLDFGTTPSLCPAFALRLVRGVRNGPSPAWLQRRLIAIGLRPINALVDITNFITYDRGRPLHVFDAAKVQGDLTVRRARDGESLVALDGKDYSLDPSMCVIADESGVESLAGIMGGEEHRLFGNNDRRAHRIRAVGPREYCADRPQARGPMDARYRFERGVDPAFMLPGLELATAMVLDLCGGKPSEVTVAGTPEVPARIIDFPLNELPRLTGLHVDRHEMRARARPAWFCGHRHGKHLKVTVPSWRADVEGKADLVEEIVRIVGVDRIPATPFERGEAPRKPVLTPIQLRTRKAKRALAARGMLEAVTWSFLAKQQAELFGGGNPELALANPDCLGSIGYATESHSGASSAAAQNNADRGFADVALFEVGQVFRGDRPQDQLTPRAACAANSPRPPASAAIGRHPRERSTRSTPKPTRLPCWPPPARRRRRSKSCREGRHGSIRALGDDPNWPADGPRAFWRAASARARSARRRGPAGRLRGDAGKIPEPKAKATRARPVLELSPSNHSSATSLLSSIARCKADRRVARGTERRSQTDHQCRGVRRLRGQGDRARKKSIAISVTLQPGKDHDRREIEAVAGKIVAEVGKRTGGALRGDGPHVRLLGRRAAHHRICRSLARLPGAVDSAPTGLMRGLTGQEHAAADRLVSILRADALPAQRPRSRRVPMARGSSVSRGGL